MDDIFWMGFYTFGGGFILAVLALAYKSKCEKVKCCFGCCEIDRAVDVELQEDLKRMEIKDQFKDPEL
jgi:hypothetical protein